ncbi:MAG: (deoxy)nucleoside triphosphate pyrophosphohydrolase [Pseudonocardiaceae bacterium]
MPEPPSAAPTNTSQPAVAERVPAEQLVVAAAVLHEGRVLVQQRAHPPATAGRWELPGGRVERGESAPDALVRECREELAVEIVPGEQLGPDVPLPGGYLLRVHAARLADPAAQPIPVEHAALRWVDVTELAGLDWLDADRAVLPHLEPLLPRPSLRQASMSLPGVPSGSDKHPCRALEGIRYCDMHPCGC